MRIEFDPAKDATNGAKHGVSLALAERLDRDAALAWQDTRFGYGELRMIALAPESNILYCVAFVDRGESAADHQLAQSRTPRGEAACRKLPSDRRS